jgi:hypothetical protein
MTASVALLRRAADPRICRPFVVLVAVLLLGCPRTAPLGAQPVLRVQAHRRAPWQQMVSPAGAAPQWRSADTALARQLQWRALRPGVSLTRFRAAVDDAAQAVPSRAALQFEIVVVRLDLRHVRLRLHVARGSDGGAEPWDIEQAPSAAVVALNAGQFTDDGPWGWIVYNERELQPPGTGALAGALMVTSAGQTDLLDADSIAAARTRGQLRWALQSYPALLTGNGFVPAPLLSPGAGVDLTHRDARLALGVTRDGALLIVLTRFATLGTLGERLPVGPTTPEMSALMGALGSARALMLDGGLSAQLLVRDARGAATRWPGLRRVPVGLIAESTDPGRPPPR